jgi:hypothetical protein
MPPPNKNTMVTVVTGHNIRVYICLWKVRSGLRSARIKAAGIGSCGSPSIIPLAVGDPKS